MFISWLRGPSATLTFYLRACSLKEIKAWQATVDKNPAGERLINPNDLIGLFKVEVNYLSRLNQYNVEQYIAPERCTFRFSALHPQKTCLASRNIGLKFISALRFIWIGFPLKKFQPFEPAIPVMKSLLACASYSLTVVRNVRRRQQTETVKGEHLWPETIRYVFIRKCATRFTL